MDKEHTGGFIFGWSITNFSIANQNGVEAFKSPSFNINDLGNTKWYLLLYPKSKHRSEYIGIYLMRAADDCGDVQIPIKFTIELKAADSSRQERRVSVKSVFKRNTIWGFDRYIKRITLLEVRKSILLPDDTLTVYCKLERASYEDKVSEIIAETEQLEFTWGLQNWSKFTDLADVCEDVHFTGKFKASFKVFICTKEKSKENLILKLKKVHAEDDSFVTCRISLLDAQFCEALLQETRHYFCKESDITSDDLFVGEEIKHTYLRDDTLFFRFILRITIRNAPPIVNTSPDDQSEHVEDSIEKEPPDESEHVEARVENALNDQSEHVEASIENEPCDQSGHVEDNIEKEPNDESEHSENRIENALNDQSEHVEASIENEPCDQSDNIENELSTNMKKNYLVYQDGILCDVKTRACSKVVSCHKNILCKKSVILKNKLDKAEQASGGCVFMQINDVDGDTLQKMIEFMYSDEIADIDYASSLQLFVAGDKYEIQGLKEKCSSYLRMSHNIENIFVHMYQNGILCDLKVRACSKVVSCHKSILYKKSVILRNKLDKAEQATEDCIVIDIDDLDGDTLQQMIDFMYFDNFTGIDYASSLKLFVAGDKYQINCLKDFCSSYLRTLLNIENIFEYMYQNGILCDVKVRACSKVVSCHKSILCKKSVILANRLDKAEQASKDCVVIDIDDLDGDTLQQMIHFMYSDEISDLDYTNSMKLFKAGDIYEIKCLKGICSSFLRTFFSFKNIFDILILAHNHKDVDLKCCALDYIKSYFSRICLTVEWENFRKTQKLMAEEIDNITQPLKSV